jgi:hypothetical protein
MVYFFGRWIMKKIRIMLIPLIVTGLLFSVMLSFAQEQVTITTYYPAPYGVYRDLVITNSILMRSGSTGIFFNDDYGIQLAADAGGGIYLFNWVGGVIFIGYGDGGIVLQSDKTCDLPGNTNIHGDAVVDNNVTVMNGMTVLGDETVYGQVDVFNGLYVWDL